jgi:hypothetical protein
VFNTIQLQLVEDALKGQSFYQAITEKDNEELYKSFPQTRKTHKDRVAELGREQETIQAEIKRLSAARDRAFAEIGTDESAKRSGREQARIDQQLENLAFDLEQRRGEKNDLQEALNNGADEYKEVTSEIKAATRALAGLFHIGHPELAVFDTVFNTGEEATTVLKCVQNETPHTLWRLLEMYRNKMKARTQTFIRSLTPVFEGYKDYLLASGVQRAHAAAYRLWNPVRRDVALRFVQEWVAHVDTCQVGRRKYTPAP